MNWVTQLIQLLTLIFKDFDDTKQRIAALEQKVQEHDKIIQQASQQGD